MAAFVLQALFPCLTLLSPSMADGVQMGNIGAALAIKMWPAFAPKMRAAFAAPFAPRMWPAFAPKMGAAFAAPLAPQSHVLFPELAPQMRPAFMPKMCAALAPICGHLLHRKCE